LDNIKYAIFYCSYFSLDNNIRSQVFLTQRAFHKLEDQLCIVDADEQKRNRVRDSEAGLDPRGNGDPYAPYHTPAGESAGLGMKRMETISTVPMQHYHSYPMLLSSDLICTRTSLGTSPFRARSTTLEVNSLVNMMRPPILVRNRMHLPEICSRTPISEV
jgi:hypothetical protein